VRQSDHGKTQGGLAVLGPGHASHQTSESAKNQQDNLHVFKKKDGQVSEQVSCLKLFLWPLNFGV
jgi:hypothetical protein